jgi:hypothetical protein
MPAAPSRARNATGTLVRTLNTQEARRRYATRQAATA